MGDPYRATNTAHAWREKLHEQIVRKSVDIPANDDMQISHVTKNGIGWKEIAAIGAAAAGLLAAYNLKREPPAANPPPPPAVSETIQIREEYDIVFFDDSGNQIAIPRRSHGGVD